VRVLETPRLRDARRPLDVLQKLFVLVDRMSLSLYIFLHEGLRSLNFVVDILVLRRLDNKSAGSSLVKIYSVCRFLKPFPLFRREPFALNVRVWDVSARFTCATRSGLLLRRFNHTHCPQPSPWIPHQACDSINSIAGEIWCPASSTDSVTVAFFSSTTPKSLAFGTNIPTSSSELRVAAFFFAFKNGQCPLFS
jgi:hypothetical protein